MSRAINQIVLFMLLRLRKFRSKAFAVPDSVRPPTKGPEIKKKDGESTKLSQRAFSALSVTSVEGVSEGVKR
jgi:hypothetical protein